MDTAMENKTNHHWEEEVRGDIFFIRPPICPDQSPSALVHWRCRAMQRSRLPCTVCVAAPMFLQIDFRTRLTLVDCITHQSHSRLACTILDSLSLSVCAALPCDWRQPQSALGATLVRAHHRSFLSQSLPGAGRGLIGNAVARGPSVRAGGLGGHEGARHAFEGL